MRDNGEISVFDQKRNARRTNCIESPSGDNAFYFLVATFFISS